MWRLGPHSDETLRLIETWIVLGSGNSQSPEAVCLFFRLISFFLNHRLRTLPPYKRPCIAYLAPRFLPITTRLVSG